MQPTVFLVGALLAAPVFATETNVSMTIGGPGSFGSNGSSDPGTLGNGTPASAAVTVQLDDQTGVLVVTVQNTSPVTVGVCNPALTEVFFNLPVSVTGITLDTQVGSGGATPAFTMNFDSNVMSNPNPNNAGNFGAFSVHLNNQNIAGGIANPVADTVPGPPGSLVTGPVVFTFTLTGSVDGLTANHLAATFSGTPPGNHPSHMAAKFQGGGSDCDGSGFINDAVEECVALIGLSSGPGNYPSPLISQHVFPTQVSNVRMYHGVTLDAPLLLQLPDATNVRRLGRVDGTPGAVPGVHFYIQVVMWNPGQFPANPEQFSNGIEVGMFADGTYTARTYGAGDGMTLDCTTFTLPDGRRYLQLPFSIDGI